MKLSKSVLRILCGLVDAIIIMIPIQFIMMGVFQVSMRQGDLFLQLLFAVYGVLLNEYWGMTVGKYFGKLCIVDMDGQKVTMMYLGLRELSKSLYFIPYVGWGLCLISIIMMLVRKDGRTLHDFIANTNVVFRWQLQKKEE